MKCPHCGEAIELQTKAVKSKGNPVPGKEKKKAKGKGK